MKLLDSNILIYSARDAFSFLRPLVKDPANAISSISIIEVLGYPKLIQEDREYFEAIFRILQIIDIERDIVLKATALRQERNVSVPDAIVAATALIHNYELQSRNEADFTWISGLRFSNPIPNDQ